MMSLSQSSVLKVYKTVIDDVINSSRDLFIDEGLDEQVVQELRHLWESKLLTSRSVDSGGGSSAIAGNSSVTSVQGAAVSSTASTSANLPSMSAANNENGKQKNVDVKPNIAKNPVSEENTDNYASDANKLVPIQITLPQKDGSQANMITIQIPMSVLNQNRLTSILTSQVIQTAMELPPNLAATLLQDHVNSKLISEQLDGNRDSSDDELFGTSIIEEDFDDDNDNDDDNDDDDNDDYDDKPEMETFREDDDDEAANEEDPLNSGDDVSEIDNDDLFDTDNVVVCQYDKITRSRNKWKFYLKDGIMNLSGKDFVFQKCTGEAEW